MKKAHKNIAWSLILAFSLIFLSACGAAAPAEPTQDPNMVFTQVAQTVVVSMTQTAEAMPPTATPEPSPTPEPTQSSPPTPFPTQAGPAQPPGPTPTIQRFGDAAKYNTQDPKDGRVFKVSEQFAFHVCFGNIGSTDWGTSYYLEYVDGFNLWSNTSTFYIEDVVEPGGTWCFDLPSVAPWNPGGYITRWYLKNPDGEFMHEAYFNYKVEQ